MKKLSPNALGIAIGILWAAYVLFCGITAMFGGGVALVDAISSLYVGYGPSVLGAIIGAVWGFVDGYIAGVIIAWLYNRLARSQRD
jgi:hypothetical protein